MSDSADINISDTAAVIAAFGGIRPMAHKLDVPVSTVQGWKQRNIIPENRIADILAAAAAHDVDLAAIVAVSDTAAASADTPEAEETVPPPTETARPEASQLPQNRGSDRLNTDRGVLIIAVIALVIAVAVGGWQLFGGGDQSAGTTAGTDLTGITDRLAALESTARSGPSKSQQDQVAADIAGLRAELERIAKAPTGNGTSAAAIDELASRQQVLETKLGQIQRQAANQAQAASAKIAATKTEIGQLRQQIADLDGNEPATGQHIASAVGLALATGRVQRALESGAPLEQDIATLRALAAGDTAIGALLDRLAERAGAGVPTPDALARTFAYVARDVVAVPAADTASGWTDRTLQRLRNVVSVRRVGLDVPGDTPEARIARAEAKLAGGDLSGAVSELDSLSGAAADAVAPWLGGARARLNAVDAVIELEALAIARLQSGNGGS